MASTTTPRQITRARLALMLSFTRAHLVQAEAADALDRVARWETIADRLLDLWAQ